MWDSVMCRVFMIKVGLQHDVASMWHLVLQSRNAFFGACIVQYTAHDKSILARQAVHLPCGLSGPDHLDTFA